MNRYALALLLLAAAPAAAPPAAAQVMPREPDQVTFEVAAEEWVQTETATVRVAVDAAFPGGQGGAVREQVLAALARTAPDAKWVLTQFDQIPDSSGLERWRVAAEVRLKEAQTSGLRQRAEQASRPGLKVSVAAIDFTPSLAEREAVQSRLREQIYGQVKAELARLNGAYPDRKYRVRVIGFDAGAMPMPRVRALAAPMEAQAAAAPAPLNVAQKAVLRATVTLAAE